MKLRDAVFTPWRLLPFMLPGFIHRLIYAGTAGYSRRNRRSLAVANITGYLGTFSSTSFAVAFAFHDFNALAGPILGNLLSAAASAMTPLTHRFGRTSAVLYLAVVFYISLFYFVSVLGRESGIQLNYIAAAAIATVILGSKRIRLAGLIIAVGLVLHIATWFAFPVGSKMDVMTAEMTRQIYAHSAATIMIILTVTIFYILRLHEEAEARSDALLLNMMPEVIAERLIENPRATIADRHDEASVMFADLVGFTPLATKLGPEGIVELLDDLFSHFDALAEKYDVEKIKTIGDAYMVVSGAPRDCADHANQIARLSIDLHQAVRALGEKRGQDLALRIGMEAGPVMAGIIGQTKFSYDIWGRTVNIAARLEPLGEPGTTIVGDGAKRLLEDRYEFSPSGELKLRGIGMHRAWRLVAAKPAGAPAINPPAAK